MMGAQAPAAGAAAVTCVAAGGDDHPATSGQGGWIDLAHGQGRRLAAARRPLPAVERDAYAAILKAGFERVDYVVVRHADSLAPFANSVVNAPARILVAAWLGKTRLIDNMPV